MYRFIAILLAFVLIVLSWVSININGGSDDWKGILESDAKGYYAYLPAVFIYHDLNFSFLEEVEEKYDQPHLYYDYRNSIDGKLINKYYAGVSVAQLPFFMGAHLVSKFDHQDLDGYSKWYMYSIIAAAIFYHLLGLFFIYALLKSYEIKQYLIAFILLTISFGTNLFAYTIVEPGMSHVYSFAFISMFLYYARKHFENPNKKGILILGALFGIIVLIRPVNGLILFILPFLAGSYFSLLYGLHKLFSGTLLWGLILFFAVLSIQSISYQIATGSIWVYSYLNEGFNFSQPHLIDILISYKKGLFLYTPFYLLAFLALFYFIRRSPYLFWAWMLFFWSITYVFSSWWMWYYGGSFSSRVYVEYLPVFALPLGIVLQSMRTKRIRFLMLSGMLLITILCQIQTYQYRYYDIHYSEMNEEKYWEVFLMRDKY